MERVRGPTGGSATEKVGFRWNYFARGPRPAESVSVHLSREPRFCGFSPLFAAFTNMHERLLVVDDEPVLRETLAKILRDLSYTVRVAADVPSALKILQNESVDLIFSDVKMLDPESGQLSSRAGFDLLAILSDRFPGTPVVMVTASQSIDTAVEAMRSGAVNYLVKPFRRDEIRAAVEGALTKSRSRASAQPPGSPIQSVAASMAAAVEAARRAAQSDVNVLITGPAGSGKEFTAKAIHRASARKEFEFTPVAIRSITESLFDAELFGAEKGAFTGAIRMKRGTLELAGRGTVFFDAIDETPLSLQSKLLPSIEKKEIRRLGSARPVLFAARIMAGVTKPLSGLVESGAFRNDLYYALRVLTIELPHLRDRREDIPLIARSVALDVASEVKQPITIGDSALDVLVHYSFPGNIRELRNLIQSAATLKKDGHIGADEVRQAVSNTSQPRLATIHDAVQKAEREKIQEALERNPGSLNGTARDLGISRTTLWRKMRDLGLASAGDMNTES